MKIRSITFIPILIFLGGMVTWSLGGYFGEVLKSEQSEGKKSLIQISEQSLTLSKVWEQEGFGHKIWIDNLSDQELSVALSADCSCTTLSTLRIKIPPNSRKSFIAVFELVRGNISDPVQATELGKFEATIKTTIRSPYFEAKNWKIDADLRPAIYMSSSSLVINTSDTAEKPVEVRVPISTLNGIESIRIENTQEDICTAFINNYTRHDSDYMLTLKPNLTLSAGLYSGTIKIYTQPVDGKYFLARNLTYKVNVESDWRVTPDAILLSNLSIDNKRTVLVRIESKSKSPFKIIKYDFKKHFGKNFDFDIEHSNSSPHVAVLEFTIHGQLAGVHSGVVEVFIKLSNGKESVLQLPVSFSISAHEIMESSNISQV